MSKQITLIKRKQLEVEKDGELIITSRNYKRNELVQLLRDESDLFFKVPEAHAIDVVLRQGKYQEVYEDIIEEAKKPAPKAPSSRSNSSQSNGS